MTISLELASTLAQEMGPAELVDAIREIDGMVDADESYLAFRRMCFQHLQELVGAMDATVMTKGD